MYQSQIAANTCPDYWTNVSTSENELKCQNTHNLGKYNFGDNIKDFSTELYKDDINKCRYAKIAKISWEGIDNLCANVTE